MEPVCLFIPVVAIVVAAIVAGAILSQQRRKTLAAWALRRGLTFRPDKVRDYHMRYPQFDCLKRGHSRYAYNFAQGACSGLRITAFDYHYATGSGKHRHDHYFSAVIIDAPLPLRPLIVRSENLLDKLAGAFGYDDIDFESAQFSRQFYVASPDRKWAFDVLHARTIEFLLAGPRYSFQFDRSCILVWHRARLDPAQFEQAIALVQGVLDRLPDYVRKQQEISL